MRVSCIQMDMRLGDADYNFAHADELVRAAAARGHDKSHTVSTKATIPERAK